MITRRQLISSGVVAAGGLMTRASTPAAPAAAESAPPAKLPPSIERLKSRRSDAKPISRAERHDRHERARKLMAESGLDALVLADGTSLDYFTAVRWWGSERFFAAVLPVKGEPFYVCPAFEEGRAREQLARGSDGEHPDVRTWQEDDNPYQRLAEGLRDRNLATAKIGVEETVKFVFTDAMATVAPNAHFASATLVTAGCRMIKSPAEIALMRLAAEVTHAAYEAAYRAIVPGMTNTEFGALTRAAHERLGFTGAAELVLIGEFSAFPHGSVAPQHIREGTIILIDGGCTVEGYCSDISRTFVLGKASPKMKSVFDTVHRAQAAALAAARPGVECGAIDLAARNVIIDAGFGPGYKYFTHRLGHGMGMDGHEWPYLVRGNTKRLAANMTTSNEPGIYIRGEFGVRLEDDMHITENGAELFTPTSPSLEEPFARP